MQDPLVRRTGGATCDVSIAFGAPDNPRERHHALDLHDMLPRSHWHRDNVAAYVPSIERDVAPSSSTR